MSGSCAVRLIFLIFFIGTIKPLEALSYPQRGCMRGTCVRRPLMRSESRLELAS